MREAAPRAPAEDAAFAVPEAPAPLVRWKSLFAALPLLLALIAAVAMYFPALNAPFVSDDYIYLYSVQKLSLLDYLHASLVPDAHSTVLVFTADFWRPLYFLSFEGTGRAFGDNVVPYHLLNVAIHLVAVVLVWVLARRLTRRWEAAAVACAFFAVHPAGFDSVAWISSVNSVALPLGLAAWLVFMSAVEAEAPRRRRLLLGASVLLLTVAFGFRETAIVALTAMALWYLFVPARARLRDSRTYTVLLPYIGLCVAYALLRTRFFTVAAANTGAYHFDTDTPGHAWYYLKLGLFPFTDQGVSWHVGLERAGAVVLLAAIPLAALFKRWLLVALLIAFVASVLPFAPLALGVAPRYFYFPSAFLALALGAAAVELLDAAKRVTSPAIPVYALAAVLPLGLVAGGYAGNDRVESWVDHEPDIHQAWVDELRAEFPVLPAGGTLYTTNTPLLIALFDNAVLLPTVGYYYPQVANAVRFDPAKLAQIEAALGPNDRIFVYDGPR